MRCRICIDLGLIMAVFQEVLWITLTFAGEIHMNLQNHEININHLNWHSLITLKTLQEFVSPINQLDQDTLKCWHNVNSTYVWMHSSIWWRWNKQKQRLSRTMADQKIRLMSVINNRCHSNKCISMSLRHFQYKPHQFGYKFYVVFMFVSTMKLHNMIKCRYNHG